MDGVLPRAAGCAVQLMQGFEAEPTAYQTGTVLCCKVLWEQQKE